MSWVENNLRQSIHANILLGIQFQDSKNEGGRSVRKREGVTLLHWLRLQKKTQLALWSPRMSPDKLFGTTVP